MMVSDMANPDVWLRAGTRLRQCMDEFDNKEDAYRQVDVVSILCMPVATGLCRLKVVDLHDGKRTADRPPGDLFAAPIGERIRSWRTDQGLTLQEAAEQLGVSKGTVGNWEAGRTKPRGEGMDRAEAWVRNEETPQAGVPRVHGPVLARA